MSQEKLSYRQKIEKMETELKDMEDTIHGKKLGWFSTVAKIVKYPVAAWSAIFGGAIAASAIEMAGGGAISTTLALSSLSLPLGGVAVATIATGTMIVMTFNYFDRFLQKRVNKELAEASQKLENSRVDLLSNLSGGESIDFVFNQTSSLKPHVMSSDRIKALIGELKDKSDADFILNQVELSDVQLKDNDFKNLLSGGLGRFKSQKLILRNNQLTNGAIHYLGQCIRKYKAFQTLKSLDLSGNKLTSECLSVIYEIASLLELEELDLSDNEFGNQALTQQGEENHLDKFLYQHLNTLPFLRKLSLRNIGLSYENKSALKIFLTGLNAIESLDLRKNAALEYSFFQDYFVKGKGWLCHNLSLKELKTDHDAELLTDNILAKNDERFVQAGHKKEQSRLMFLLRSLVNKLELPSIKSTLRHFKILEKTALFIRQNEELAKNDTLWLSALKLVSEKMIFDAPEEVEQEAVSPPLLKQFSRQKRIVRLLLEGVNGFNLLYSGGDLLRHDSKTNAIKWISISDIVSIMQKQNKNKHVLPDVDEDGNNIAIGLVNNNVILLKGDAQTNTWEQIEIRSLPQGTLEIRSKEPHQSNQEINSTQESEEATPRLAS